MKIKIIITGDEAIDEAGYTNTRESERVFETKEDFENFISDNEKTGEFINEVFDDAEKSYLLSFEDFMEMNDTPDVNSETLMR